MAFNILPKQPSAIALIRQKKTDKDLDAITNRAASTIAPAPATRPRWGGLMGLGTNQPSAIQEIYRQKAARDAAASTAQAPIAVDPSKVTGVPLGVDPSKVTGVPLSFSAGIKTTAAPAPRWGGLMGLGTNQPSAIQEIYRQKAARDAEAMARVPQATIAPPAQVAPAPRWGGLMGLGTNQPSAIQEIYRQKAARDAAASTAQAPIAVDPSKVTGVPLGVDPSKVTGAPLSLSAGMGMSPEAMARVPSATIAPPAQVAPGAVAAPAPMPMRPSGSVAAAGGRMPQTIAPPMVGPPTLGSRGVQNSFALVPNPNAETGAVTGAVVSTPTANREFSADDIARIAADPNAGRWTPPPSSPATMAQAMQNTGTTRMVTQNGQSVDPNDIARKEWAAGTGTRNPVVAATLAAQAESQRNLMQPRLTGKTGAMIDLAREGQKSAENAAMAGMVAKQAENQANRKSKETIAAGQNKARVEAAKAGAARPQDAQSRAQQVKAYAEAVAAAQAELDAAKADVGVWNSAADKKRVAAAEKRLADAVKRQEDAASMAGAVTNDTPVQVMTQEEYDALPPGTKLIDSTGKQKTKGQSPA